MNSHYWTTPAGKAYFTVDAMSTEEFRTTVDKGGVPTTRPEWNKFLKERESGSVHEG